MTKPPLRTDGHDKALSAFVGKRLADFRQEPNCTVGGGRQYDLYDDDKPLYLVFGDGSELVITASGWHSSGALSVVAREQAAEPPVPAIKDSPVRIVIELMDDGRWDGTLYINGDATAGTGSNQRPAAVMTWLAPAAERARRRVLRLSAREGWAGMTPEQRHQAEYEALLDVSEAAREAIDWMDTWDDGPGGSFSKDALTSALVRLDALRSGT